MRPDRISFATPKRWMVLRPDQAGQSTVARWARQPDVCRCKRGGAGDEQPPRSPVPGDLAPLTRTRPWGPEGLGAPASTLGQVAVNLEELDLGRSGYAHLGGDRLNLLDRELL